MISNINKVIATLLILLHCSTQVFAEGFPSSGKRIATQWCASCHVVVEGQAAAFTSIPTFKSIAEKYRDNDSALGAFLFNPHPPMPDMSLTRHEIQDLMAYIRSLE